MSTSRLDDLRMVDPVLTTVARGHKSPELVGDYLFPVVEVSKLKGKIPVFGKESFVIRDYDRAIRAQSNRIPPSEVTLVEFETKEKDVEIALDYVEEEESPDFHNLEQRVAKQLTDILALDREKTIADYVQNASNFAAGLKYAVDGDHAWDDLTNGVDPVKDIQDGVEAVRSQIGIRPNTLIIGQSAWESLIFNTRTLEKIQYSGLAKVGTKIISELTELPHIYVGRAIYSDDGDTFSDVWNDHAIIAYVDRTDPARRNEYNPSYGYTFRREGKPEIDVYYENGGKIKVVRNTDNYAVKVVGSDAAYLISNVNHS